MQEQITYTQNLVMASTSILIGIAITLIILVIKTEKSRRNERTATKGTSN